MLGWRGIPRGTPLSGRKTQPMGKKSPNYVTTTILLEFSCRWRVGPRGHACTLEPRGPIPIWPPCGFFSSRAISIPADGCPFRFPERPSRPPACHLHDPGDVFLLHGRPRVSAERVTAKIRAEAQDSDGLAGIKPAAWWGLSG